MSMDTESATQDCVEGATRKQILRLREKLLDLSKRNPLVSFRHSPRSRKQLRIIDELPDELFARIALAEDASMHFVELPDVDESVPLDEQNNEEFDKAVIEAQLTDEIYLEEISKLKDDEAAETILSNIERALKNRVRDQLCMPPLSDAPKLSNSEIARRHGIEPAYALPSSISNEEKAPKHIDTAIQTLLKRNEMDRRLGNLFSEVRTMQQEQGVNALYCMFGFIRWFESDNSNVERLAPLLMLPIQMSRELKNGRYRYDIRSDGADTLETNRCFDEMLKRQFGQSLPELEENDTPESYFQKASEQFAKNQPRWAIKRYVTIGILSFQRLKMYLDLAPNEWAEDLDENTLVQNLLSGSEPSQSISQVDPSTRDVFEILTIDPCLVADADASQFSVVLDCMNNRNIAVEGPPGTGKSQTITNIISSALFEGKTVLFLAEKVAALDVVKNRLDDAGIGEFCLELHSTKVSKKALLTALSDRLKASDINHRQIPEHENEELKRLRRDLNAFASLINDKASINSERSVYDIFWALQLAEYKLRELANVARQTDYGIASTLSAPDYQKINAVLADLIHTKQKWSTDLNEAGQHPWQGITADLTNPFDRQNFVAKCLELKRAIEESTVLISQLLPNNNDHSSISTLTLLDDIARLSNNSQAITPINELLLNLLDERHAQTISTYLEALDFYKTSKDKRSIAENENIILEERDQLFCLFDEAQKLDLVNIPCNELSSVSKKKCFELGNSENALRYIADIQKIFSLAEMISVEDAIDLVNFCECVINLNAKERSWLAHSQIEPEKLHFIAKLGRQAQGILKQRSYLSDIVDFENVPSISELEEASTTLADATTLGGLLSSKIRNARKLLHPILKRSKKLSDKDASDLLGDVSNYLSDEKAFNEKLINYGLEQIFPDGMSSDFAGRLSAEEKRQQLVNQFDGLGQARVEVRRALTSDESSVFGDISKTLDARSLRAIQKYLETLPYDAILAEIEDQIEVEKIAAVRIGEIGAALDRYKIRESNSLDDIQRFLNFTGEMAKIENFLEKTEQVGSILNDVFRGLETDPETIRWHLECASKIKSLTDDQPLQKDFATHIRDILKHKAVIKAVKSKIMTSFNEVNSLSGIDEAFFPGTLESASFQNILMRIEFALSNSEALANQAQLIRCYKNCSDEGLNNFLEVAHSQNIEIDRIHDLFEYAYIRSLAKEVMEKYPHLCELTSEKIENKRRRFCHLDRRSILNNRVRLRNQLCKTTIREGRARGLPRDLTEKALIRHEIGKRARHISVRDLMKRAGNAVLDMMPCFMMSPLSVAQFLPRKEIFDLVVIDEASQMRPEDALGAIARARQILVVGDTKQLPPTSFFDRNEDEDDVDPEDVEDSEAILNVASKALHPSRMLKWHYRSKHENLISFSNRHFYNGELIVFPSPSQDASDLGVKYKYIGDAECKSGINAIEASNVASAALEHMITKPDESLGIVAMNKKQADLIRSEIEQMVATNFAAADYVSRWQDQVESFIVKNLENIQGDERDTIIVSTTYGPDPETGRVYQRFGPINSEFGWRRLNVLFTRAKKRMEIYSSLQASDIQTDEKSSRGVIALRNYIDFAANGRLDGGAVAGRETDSDFETMVMERLEADGFEVVPQVGVDGFFIDLAVSHPSYPHGYLLGIECDGATYHSSKSARDRDRLRQEILESLGWRIYRIWSTDWFQNSEQEYQRLKRHVAHLLQEHVNEGEGIEEVA